MRVEEKFFSVKNCAIWCDDELALMGLRSSTGRGAPLSLSINRNEECYERRAKVLVDHGGSAKTIHSAHNNNVKNIVWHTNTDVTINYESNLWRENMP